MIDIAIGPNGSNFASTADDQQVKVWSTTYFEQLASHKKHLGKAISLVILDSTTVASAGEDGKVKVVTVDSILYDTLSNGKIVAINLPGEVQQVAVNEEETYLRTNFSTSDNRNFRDGDKRSTRYFESFNFDGEDEEEDEGSGRMYNAPRHRVDADTFGNMVREYDKSDKRTSLINDEVRVYKGGSWRDREYWLDPAQRRYFPQDMATDYIGFRCAMSRVGSKSKGNKKRARN